MTLREWVLLEGGDPGEAIVVNGVPVSRQKLVDSLELNDLLSSFLVGLQDRMEELS